MKGYCQCGCGQKTKVAKYDHHGQISGEPLKFIHGHNARMSNHYAWIGGRINRKKKYVLIKNSDHARADSQGYVREHILIAEKALGKNLPEKAVIHHHSPTDLVICQDQAYHLFIEQRTRAYKACGNVHWRKCPFCKFYDDPTKMEKHSQSMAHASCKSTYKKTQRIKSAAHLEEAAGRL